MRAEACQYGAKYGADARAGGEKGLLRKCNAVCDPGEKFCPRHKLIQALNEDTAADKAAKKGVRS